MKLSSIAEAEDIGWIATSHIWYAFRDLVSHPSELKTDKVIRLQTGDPHPFGNFVFLSDPEDSETARDAVAPLVESNVPALAVPVSKVESGAGIDVLTDNGFQLVGAMPAMAVDSSALSETSLPDGYEFVRVSEDDVDEWVDCLSVAYEIPHLTATTFAPSGSDHQPGSDCLYYSVKKDGETVGTTLVYLHGGVAGIYCVATLEAHRGKGLGAHATAEPLRIASERGYGVGVLQSSEKGHGVYSKLGFQEYGKVPMYIRMPE